MLAGAHAVACDGRLTLLAGAGRVGAALAAHVAPRYGAHEAAAAGGHPLAQGDGGQDAGLGPVSPARGELGGGGMAAGAAVAVPKPGFSRPPWLPGCGLPLTPPIFAVLAILAKAYEEALFHVIAALPCPCRRSAACRCPQHVYGSCSCRPPPQPPQPQPLLPHGLRRSSLQQQQQQQPAEVVGLVEMGVAVAAAVHT